MRRALALLAAAARAAAAAPRLDDEAAMVAYLASHPSRAYFPHLFRDGPRGDNFFARASSAHSTPARRRVSEGPALGTVVPHAGRLGTPPPRGAKGSLEHPLN